MVSLDSKIAPIKNFEWEQSSPISKVELRDQGKGQVVAYIHASEQAQGDYAHLYALREEFRRKGWATSSDNHHGRAVLRVTGITDGQQVLDVLESSKAVSGHARTFVTDVAGQSSTGMVDFVKEHSLRAAGLTYLLGDALFIQSGRARGQDWNQMKMGIAFAAGDAALMAFGGKDDKRQFRSLLEKLKDNFNAQGIDIPEGTALNAETIARGGIIDRTYEFLHKNINTIKISAEVLGGYYCLKAGLGEQKNNFKVASGITIMTGWLAALLVHEKKRDPEAWQEASPLEKAKMYIEEKPLRLAGWAGLAHNAIYTTGALVERKKTLGQADHYKWDMAGTGAMLAANSLYSICSKSTGGDIKTDALLNDIYGIAAQILNRQPDNVREAAIESTVKFLGERPEIKDSKQEINRRLREEIDMQSQNPWFKSIRRPENGIGQSELSGASHHAAAAINNSEIRMDRDAVTAQGAHARALMQRREAQYLGHTAPPGIA